MHRSYSYAGHAKRNYYADKNEIHKAAELLDAVEEQSLSDVLMLLERDGANPNILLPNKGIAPFHLVVGSDNEDFAEEATRLFLQHDGNPNIKSDEGLTPVHVAAVWGRVRLLALLLACGGDPWVMDRESSQTPLQLAAKHHRWEAALLLQRYQLLDKKSRSTITSPSALQPKYSLQLERVVVSNGEVEAEYAATKGEGEPNKVLEDKHGLESAVQQRPVNDVLSPWNRASKLRTSQEYVRQWCQSQPLTSPESSPNRFKPSDSPKTPNISGYSSVSTARADSTPKELPKKICRNGDVRRNLFLELKKRFSSPKSGQSSESDTEKKSRKVFSRLIGKKKKTNSSDESKKAIKPASCVGDSSETNSVVTESGSPEDDITAKTNEPETSTLHEPLITPDNSPLDDDCGSVVGTERFGTPLNSSLITEDVIDEVDAVPLPSRSDTPVNGLPRGTSQEMLQEVITEKLLREAVFDRKNGGARSPDSIASQMYFTCDEDDSNLATSPVLTQVLQTPVSSLKTSLKTSAKMVHRSKSAPRLLRVKESPKKRIKSPAPQPPGLPSPKQVSFSSSPSSGTLPSSKSSGSLRTSSHSSDSVRSPMILPPSHFSGILRSPVNISSPVTHPSSYSSGSLPSPVSLPFSHSSGSPRSPGCLPSPVTLSSPRSSESFSSPRNFSSPVIQPSSVSRPTVTVPSPTRNSPISSVALPPPPPPLPRLIIPSKDEEIFKVPQRPPRRKQSLRFKISEDKENPAISPDLEESLSKVFKPCIAFSPCMQHAVLQYVPSASSSDSHSTATFVSVAEEYIYTDEEHGVCLVEKRLLAKPPSVPNLDVSSVGSSLSGGDSDAVSDVSSLPATFTYESDRLRKELEARGVAVGPITTTTKRVYLRQLYRLQKKGKTIDSRSPGERVYCPEVDRIFKMPDDWQFELAKYASLEEAMCAPFDNPDPGCRWREGLTKSSFNYLLLDPRISQNLPRQLTCFNKGNLPLEAWKSFLSAIFYIGKGKRSRPYAHLYQAVRVWGQKDISQKHNPKVARILDIWHSGQGVVCLHVYQNIIPVEAFTREAAMIDALGLENVVNAKGGEYYGPAATWGLRQKRRLGIYLLYRALCVFVSEGERQLRPNDIN